MKTAIFLGAGASAAEGAPIQNSLFKAYFKSKNINRMPDIFRELTQFFKAMFGIDLDGPLEKIAFPTFEEALGILDLSELRRESFRGFDFAGAVPQGNKVQLLRLYLILVMAKAIADGLKKGASKRYHQLLVQSLKRQKKFGETIFISTNYDLLIDEALGWEVDYGVEFSGTQKFGAQGTGAATALRLLKIHGSLNWLYCPVCNNLNSYETKAVLSLMHTNKPITKCGFCDAVMSHVIVPPTFYKDMSRVFLSSIWNKTENALRDVNQIIFCGYSLPDADMHVKYLLKRMQTNRGDSNEVQFVLVNHHAKKDKKDADTEEQRFLRFLGKNVIDTRQSFEEFAQDPERFYEKPARKRTAGTKKVTSRVTQRRKARR